MSTGKQMRGRSTSKTAKKSPYDQNPRSRSSSPTAKLQDRLWRACRNDLQGVKDCLASGALLSWRNRSGSTYLHRAAQCGSMPIVQVLIEADKSLINVQDKNGETPLHQAATHGWGK